jgi:tRNA(fMet)-specific endonuclease VapC
MLLLDTNIVSFIFKGDTRARHYHGRLQNEPYAISFITAGELYKWLLERNWGEKRRAELDHLMRSYLVLPYDDALARTWASLMAAGKQRGRIPGYADSRIASTALRHDLVLVTHNPRDFAGIEGLKIWTQAPAGG